MNTFGRLFRITLFGESHGPTLGVVIDGCPPGIALASADFDADLSRRRGGRLGTTARMEEDIPSLRSGWLENRTTGSPLTIEFENSDIRPADYESYRHIPRPGHADFTARRKFAGFNDWRGGGRFSGRMSLALVAAGVVAKKILSPASVEASLIEAGGSTRIDEAVRSARDADDSIGGLILCRVSGLPAGLGEPFFDSVESCIGHLVFAVPGIKGIEFGAGFACSRMRGSVNNDAILDVHGKTRTNNAGGINGGLSNGNDIIFRVAVRPPATIPKDQDTVDLRTGRPAVSVFRGRHDTCIALRLPVVIEAAAAVVLADFMLLDRRILRTENGPWTS